MQWSERVSCGDSFTCVAALVQGLLEFVWFGETRQAGAIELTVAGQEVVALSVSN